MTEQPRTNNVAVTAGLRGAMWNPELMQAPYTATVAPLVTDDGQSVQGVLYYRSKSTRVAFIMHPREFVMSHYLIPYVLAAGWACWVQGARNIGNDLRLEHETAVLDVAAGMKHLKSQGFDAIVLIGNSGGAGLFALYNQQSQLDGQQRLSRTPGGRPVNLAAATLPVADGIALVSPHPGQGILLMNALDPSIVDETDPLSVNAELDPFSRSNGFNRPPDSSRYSAAFIQQYRAAQRDRVEKIDGFARDLIQQKIQARKKTKAGDGTARDAKVASHGPVFTVWRTDADLRCWDAALDPSERLVGSLWGANPNLSNLGSVGFGRVVTPESWLSTWSGISSNASMEKCASAIVQPTLIVEYTGDNCVFPADIEKMIAAIPAVKKAHVRVSGNHHGQPISGSGQPGQEIAGAKLTEWLSSGAF